MKSAMAVMGLWAFWSIPSANAYHSTDSIMNGDSRQSGYLPNHNMDPTIISGGSFGQLWQFKSSVPSGGAPDQYYSQTLVYTPSSLGRQVVLAFSEANRIYSVDAVNGTLIASRDLALEGENPFVVADFGGCNDIGGYIGITGTPVIDPSTDTIYFWAKSYLAPGLRGWQNGAYRFHAIDAATLAERPGFPTNVQGAMADNDKTRWFTGGTHLQRASLNLIHGVVYAGFGAHCDMFNYTGWVIGMSGTTGKYLTGYATSGGPGALPEDGTWTGGGGGAGIWMSGSALSSDSSGRLFFATGNGKGATINQQQPASGRAHLDTLSECMVNLAINDQNGSLTQQDYFEPAGYVAMDGGDRDLGSGGLALPDPATFSGGGISRLAITCGKNGNCYVVNADNLGGFKQGPAGGDAVIQTITPPSAGAIFGNAGTYPLEGGYLYITPVGSPTYVYSLGFDTNGRPAFTLVAQTDDLSPGAVGVGPATITTLNGQPGTAILWIVDTNGIRAYNAVPVNGKMIKINLPATPNPPKFMRPVFGNGRYYMTNSGNILGFGAPVALPLNCTSPVQFGSVVIGQTSTMIVQCTANIPITKIQGLTSGTSIFQAQNSTLPQGNLNAGTSFSFPVTFNLSGLVLSSGSTSAPTVRPGVQTTALTLFTTNGVTGYSTLQGITLTGTSVSANAFISITPLQVTFNGIVIGSAGSAGGSDSTFIIRNIGQSNMTISGYAFSTQTGGPYTNVTMDASTNGTHVLDSNGYFTSTGLPLTGSVIPAGASVTVPANFNTSVVGNDFTILTVFSDGGAGYVILTGSANTAPVALLEASTNEGGWNTIADCAVPVDGCTTQVDFGVVSNATPLLKTIRFTNNGGSNLEITKSKPPVGSVLGATNPSTDLSEGLQIPPAGKSSATAYFQPGAPVLNADPTFYSASWTLNTNDLTFGVHVLNFTGTLVPPQVGPLLNNGSAQFRYLGCFQDSTGARLEPTQFNNANNSNGLCQQQALAAGVPFAGTEYHTECWVGTVIPPASIQVADSKCTAYTCPGDITQLCGGFGGYISMYYDTTKYNPGTRTFIGGYGPPAAPPFIGAYQYAGCWSDNANARTLSTTNVGNGGTNSLDSCAAACKGSYYFGAEYAVECFCGNTLLNNPVKEPDGQCNKICPGNSSELCGAGGRLTLYSLTSNTTSSSTSSSSSSSSTSATSSTSSSTTSTTTSSSTTLSTSTTSSSSSSTSANSTVTSSSSSSSSSTTLSTSTTSSSSSSTSATSSATPWTYAGCANDTSAHRALTGPTTAGSSMTVESCQSFCLSKNYPLAGMEYSQQCFCGLSLNYNSAVGKSGCNMACAGNSAETCGGSSRLSVYNYTSYAYPQLAPSVGSYNLSGCFTDSTAARGLSDYTFASATSMTIESCISTCQGKGFVKAGVEYGTECHCGNTLAATSTPAPTSDCETMFCPGNLTEFCGAGGRLLVYSSV